MSAARNITAAVVCSLILISFADGQVRKTEESYRTYVYSESNAAFHADRYSASARFVPNVTTFGSGGVAYYSLPSFGTVSWHFGFGLYGLTDLPDRFYRGTLVDQRALAVPLYTGIKYDLLRTAGETIDLTLFTTLIGGPVFGMQMPATSDVRSDLAAMQLRWGLGGQSMLGVEVMFGEYWSGYMQAGVDMIGFTRDLGGKSAYFGPAFGLGIGRVIGR